VVNTIKKEFFVDINATILGQVLLFSAIAMIFFSYFLGRRKTETPKITAFVGFLTAFVPPLAIIFLMALVLKKDVLRGTSQNG